MSKTFNTSIVNISDMLAYNFSIPTYQRPYVWGVDQLKKLLDDFSRAFLEDKNEPYFIGTFLTKENGFDAELIDGQQRFTTLWLISYVVYEVAPSSQLSQFLMKNNSLRLDFEIREEVAEYFKFLLDPNNTEIRFDEDTIQKYPYLHNIAMGRTYIRSYFDGLKKDSKINVEEFGDFIFNKILLIKNTTPTNTDLNKLFSTINSAGIQLEQTDILKADLLKIIDDKVTYGKIWEACENLNDFFERNVRSSFPKSDFSNIHLNLFTEFDSTVFLFAEENSSTSDTTGFTIDSVEIKDILPYKNPEREIKNESRVSDEIFCRSFLNFGQFLLHSYRIHLKLECLQDFEGTFHVNRLLEIFEPLKERNDPNEVKRFMKRLWELRFIFDKYFIKWITDSDTKIETLELVNINRQSSSNNYYTRTKYEKNAMLMLQSVLYFTGDYLRQFWVTSYLAYLYSNHKNLDANEPALLKHLEQIDNMLSLSKSLTDKEASLKLIDTTIPSDFNLNEYLNRKLGTGFQHYWFFKVEYILWKNWADRNDLKFKDYRITSKNSVEHLNPQNPEYEKDILEKDILDDFGNLVLLSVAQNSEYGRKFIKVKQAEFNGKPFYDTLKSAMFFKNFKETNEIEKHIQNHKIYCISELTKHYENT